jgi:hypothetical protein
MLLPKESECIYLFKMNNIYLIKFILDQFILMITINIALKFLASGSYVIIYIYANETFPTQGRNTGMGACSMVARVGAIIGTFSNDHLVNIYIYLIFN